MNSNERMKFALYLFLFLFFWGSAASAQEKSSRPIRFSKFRTSTPTVEPGSSGLEIKNINMGKFWVKSIDEECYIFSIEVRLRYIGQISSELSKRMKELRDAIKIVVSNMSIQRAKEDYIDHFLHKNIERREKCLSARL